jgi:hypothetical protein
VNKALLDTDMLSELFKGINPTVASNATAYRQAFGRYTLSAITVMESQADRELGVGQKTPWLDFMLPLLPDPQVIPTPLSLPSRTQSPPGTGRGPRVGLGSHSTHPPDVIASPACFTSLP